MRGRQGTPEDTSPAAENQLPLVLHVLPLDLSRGAQIYARQLRDALDERGARHRTLTLFRSPDRVLEPDLALDVPSGRARRLGLDPRAITRLRRVVRRENPAVVVAHGGESLKYAVIAGVPPRRLCYYKIGVGGLRLGGVKRLLHRLYLMRTRVVGAVSVDAADEVLALGVPPARIHVIVNGRDPGAYDIGRARTADLGVTRLVFVGHLTASKRPLWFVDLVARLGSEGIAVEGAIAGDGPMLDEVRAAARENCVSVLGRVTDVPELLANADVFVFTSVIEGEGMPGVLIEAGLAALPVVATDVPGAREIVDDGGTGLIVSTTEFDDLVRATRRLVSDARLRRTFGNAARQRCVERFSLDASVRQWQALLAEVLAE
jgi:glycosyltransferase involved in cell wall biosynthesis